MQHHIYMTDYGEFPIAGRMAGRIEKEAKRLPCRTIPNPFDEDAAPVHYKAEGDYSPLVQRYFRKIKAHMRAQWEAEDVSEVDCV